jgi:hypothetical protein
MILPSNDATGKEAILFLSYLLYIVFDIIIFFCGAKIQKKCDFLT